MTNKAKTSYLELKSEKQFLKMIAANVVNRLGDSIDLIVFQIIAYQVTGSPTWMAIITGFNFVPNLLFMPFTGTLVDNLNKKKMMIICDVGRFAITLTILLFYLGNYLNPWVLLLFTFGNSTFESFRVPAAVSMRSHILDKSKFSVGISANASITRIAELAGLSIAGCIVAFSPAFALLVDGTAFIASAILIYYIQDHKDGEEERIPAQPYLEQLKGGFRYLKSNRVILYLAIFGSVMNIPENPITSFRTVYITDIIALEPWALSVVSTASSLGMAVGAVCSPKLYAKLKGRRMFMLFGSGCGLVYLLLGILPGLDAGIYTRIICATALLFLYGVTNGAIGVVYTTSFYSRVDNTYVGRVSGIFGAMTIATIPLSSFIFAGVSFVLSIPRIFILAAALCIVTYSLVYIPSELREI